MNKLVKLIVFGLTLLLLFLSLIGGLNYITATSFGFNIFAFIFGRSSLKIINLFCGVSSIIVSIWVFVQIFIKKNLTL